MAKRSLENLLKLFESNEMVEFQTFPAVLQVRYQTSSGQ